VRLAYVIATQLTLSPVVTSSPEFTPEWTVTSLPPSPTFPPTLTPTYLPSTTATNQEKSVNDDGCVPAISVGLLDEGKNICVYGTVVYTTTQNTAFSIYFSYDNGSFRVIVYDRIPKNIKIGDCVQIMGIISILMDRPVIALRYHDVIGRCSP
jgi:hypothetical protein